MATVRQYLAPEEAQFTSATGTFPQFKTSAGTNFPVSGLWFDGTTSESAYWKFEPAAYGSGNITCDVIWYADSGTTNAVVWMAALAAITPGVDTQDVETKAFATAQQVTSTHLGTTAQRLHKATITISNLDSIAAGDEAWLRIARLPADAADTMTAIDAIITSVRISYSDT